MCPHVKCAYSRANVVKSVKECLNALKGAQISYKRLHVLIVALMCSKVHNVLK